MSLLSRSTLFRDLCRLVKKGCLGSLEEVHTSVRDESELPDVIDIRFPFPRKLYINCNGRDQEYAGIISKRVQNISKGIFPSLETCIVCTGEVTCRHEMSSPRIDDEVEELVIEKCSGYLIPSMMYLRPRRVHGDEKRALASPSEAMETSQFSGRVFLFVFLICNIKANTAKLQTLSYFQAFRTFLPLKTIINQGEIGCHPVPDMTK